MTGRGGGGEVWICIFLLSCCHHLGIDQYDYDDQEGSPHADDDDDEQEEEEEKSGFAYCLILFLAVTIFVLIMMMMMMMSRKRRRVRLVIMTMMGMMPDLVSCWHNLVIGKSITWKKHLNEVLPKKKTTPQ